MSVTDPLLKDLKGHAGKFLTTLQERGAVTDDLQFLQHFCEALEKIFQQGLNENFYSGKAECWNWMENIASPHYRAPYLYCSTVAKVKETGRVQTDRGRFRLLVRNCLVYRVLHYPVEVLLQNQAQWRTYQPNSILGDEILGQIFLSVLLQCSKIQFHLNLSNALFLDETWMLPLYESLEFVPCKELGLCVGFSGGKGALVVKVHKAGVAGEDDKVLIGDVVTEINGLEITTATRTKLGSIMRQAVGQPIQLGILKARLADGKIFPPIQKLLLQMDIHLEGTITKSYKTSQDTLVGFPVHFLGEVSVGPQGDVKKVSKGIMEIVSTTPEKQKMLIEVMEMGVKVTDADSQKVVFQHSFMEISSCGKSERFPQFFAYIAGDSSSCNTSSDFKCYVFDTANEEDIANILYSIAQGFQRTHWAV
ncbi:uncharacterized protein LOC132194140 [Neocloeon triangulifer]|uniref:uncharacterized protein LOC132194140 n=1 Tax=Neocloeon triangulifer TaxID=2078957 RepID=UPI00286F3365|nr:uncharacterized protein LOC132194140 [Neocloeon triangulifer]XP_059471234.1 uncharacterized protein LOC132194140 [Neocloeon triangulifer]